MGRKCCTNNKCNYYKKCNEGREILGGNMMYNNDEDSETCLNRQILNNSVTRKAMGDMCEIPRKLIRKEIQSQNLDILT
jgi:hypothetical protein